MLIIVQGKKDWKQNFKTPHDVDYGRLLLIKGYEIIYLQSYYGGQGGKGVKLHKKRHNLMAMQPRTTWQTQGICLKLKYSFALLCTSQPHSPQKFHPSPKQKKHYNNMLFMILRAPRIKTTKIYPTQYAKKKKKKEIDRAREREIREWSVNIGTKFLMDQNINSHLGPETDILIHPGCWIFVPAHWDP